MANWAVAEAKAKFSEVVEQAHEEGAAADYKKWKALSQFVISIEEWKAEYGTDKPKENLRRVLYELTPAGRVMKIGRVRLEPRKIEF